MKKGLKSIALKKYIYIRTSRFNCFWTLFDFGLYLNTQPILSIKKPFYKTHTPLFGSGLIEKFQDYKISLGRVRI